MGSYRINPIPNRN